MLEQSCKHSRALPVESCLFCNNAEPYTLLDLCLEFIINRMETICEYEPFTSNLRLRENIALPVEICERLLKARSSKGEKLNNEFVSIFKNLHVTKLKRVKLRNTELDDKSLKILLQHRLTELDVSYSENLTTLTLVNITAFGDSLVSLTIGENTDLFPYRSFGVPPYQNTVVELDYVILAPNLKKLSIRNLANLQPYFYTTLLKPFRKLTYLDLSSCNNLAEFDYVEHLTNLTNLILYDVSGIDRMVSSICKLKNLRHLDISASKDYNGKYKNPTEMLATIVENLPRLSSLDISGTNLAGTGVAQVSKTTYLFPTDIPGLSSRVDNPFQFLGLYDTQHDACLRHDIPAKFVSSINSILLENSNFLSLSLCLYLLIKVINLLLFRFRLLVMQTKNKFSWRQRHIWTDRICYRKF